VLGVDVAETAIGLARVKAAERGVDVEFRTGDALHLQRLKRSFDSVLDCGLFHTFDGDERTAYVASLSSVTHRDSVLHVLCFSDEGDELGPHPVSRDDLHDAFNPGTGWAIVALKHERVETRFHEHGAAAWMASAKRM